MSELSVTDVLLAVFIACIICLENVTMHGKENFYLTLEIGRLKIVITTNIFCLLKLRNGDMIFLCNGRELRIGVLFLMLIND